MSWLVTPPGQALPPAGSVTDNGAVPPGLSMAIPEEWGDDPTLWPAGWMDDLPTAETFRFTREPEAVLPPYLESPIGVTGWRVAIAGAFLPYAATVSYSGAVSLRVALPAAIANTGIRVPLTGGVNPSVGVRLTMAGSVAP